MIAIALCRGLAKFDRCRIVESGNFNAKSVFDMVDSSCLVVLEDLSDICYTR